MTNDSTLWFLLAICGLATLLIGLAIFLFVAVTRLSGRGLMGVMNFFMGRANNLEHEDVAENAMARIPQTDLGQVAQAKNFDDALRAQGVPAPGQTFTAQNTPSATQFNPGFPANPPAPSGVPTPPPSRPVNTPPTPLLDNLPPASAPDLRPRRDPRSEDDAFGAFYE